MKKYLFVIFIVLCTPTHGAPAPLIAGVAQMPFYADNAEKGVLINFIHALSEESGVPITILVLPFARSMQFVKNGKVDFHLPLIKAPYTSGRALDYDFSTETIFHVNFVLYDNKHKPVNPTLLNRLVIETDLAHREYFDFDIQATTCLECSIKQVDAGRIDGMIYADMAIDPLIKRFKLNNVQRQLYKVFDVKIILPKGTRGGELDLLLSQSINRMRRNGKMLLTLGAVDQPYQNWQP